jgi:AraC-like DNA-binding protein
VLLSRNYPPSAGLEPYIRQHYVFETAQADDFELIDRVLSETAFIRILVKGDWRAEFEPDVWSNGPGPILVFGANARQFHVRVRGPFLVAGMAIRPSGWKALFGRPASELADTMAPLGDVWGESAVDLHRTISALGDDTARVAAMEAAVALQIKAHGNRATDPEMRAFERIARFESTIRVIDAADRVGLSLRQLERRCLDSFGHMPKTILGRSRFLDMAGAMRGYGDTSEDELAALRYFDDSHRNREFRRFIGMTPGAFTRTPTPLLDAGLKLRAERTV